MMCPLKIRWTLETWSIADLKDWPKNPRTLSKAQEKTLSRSLKKFGLASPVTVNRDGTLIGGHQRVSVLRSNGCSSVECYAPDRLLNEREVEELNILLNKAGGSFDYDILANEFDLLDLSEWGFSEKDFQLEEEKPTRKPSQKKGSSIKCPHCGGILDER